MSSRPCSAQHGVLTAQDVERHLLSETHLSLTTLLHHHHQGAVPAVMPSATPVVVLQETAALLPVLCAHMALYAEDDAIHRSIIDW